MIMNFSWVTLWICWGIISGQVRLWWQQTQSLYVGESCVFILIQGAGGINALKVVNQSINETYENRTHEWSWFLEERTWMGDEVNPLSPFFFCNHGGLTDVSLQLQWMTGSATACKQWLRAACSQWYIWYANERHKTKQTDKTQDQLQVRVTVGDKQWSNSGIRFCFRCLCQN